MDIEALACARNSSTSTSFDLLSLVYLLTVLVQCLVFTPALKNVNIIYKCKQVLVLKFKVCAFMKLDIFKLYLA